MAPSAPSVAETDRLTGIGAETSPPPATPSDTTARPRPRRLWELPEAARELIVGLSFPSESLRLELEKALARMHRRPCVLVGSPGAVLGSVAHDLATRNPASERLQRRLDAVHAQAVAELARVRDAATLEARWQAGLDGPGIVSAAWAVLTHPLGADLEKRVLQDARAWCWQRARGVTRAHEQLAAAQAALATARDEVDDLRRRLAEAVAALDAERLGRWRVQIEVDGLRADAHRQPVGRGPAIVQASRPTRDPATGGLPAWRPPAPTPRCETATTPAPMRSRCHAPTTEPPRPPSPPPAPAIDGQEVLCVGGIRRAVARYRAMVEDAGGRFAHHDGGVEDGVGRLEGQLARADVVVCQAGCVNHEAYHRIKRHCRATGTPCLYLERPSLSAFGQALVAARRPVAPRA